MCSRSLLRGSVLFRGLHLRLAGLLGLLEVGPQQLL